MKIFSFIFLTLSWPPLLVLKIVKPTFLFYRIKHSIPGSSGGVIGENLEKPFLGLQRGSCWDVLMPQILTVLGHKTMHFSGAPQPLPLSIAQPSTHSRLPLFGMQGLVPGWHSSLSLTKEPEMGKEGGSTQWGKFCSMGNGWWKWLGPINASFILLWANSRCNSFLNTWHSLCRSELATHF